MNTTKASWFRDTPKQPRDEAVVCAEICANAHKPTSFAPKRVEAYGAKGMKSTPWRREFKNVEAAYEWAEKQGAEVYGVRELES